MHLLSFDRSRTALTAAVTLITVGALALLALIMAHWTWRWLAPPPEPRGHPVASTISLVTGAGSLFGKVEHDRDSSTPTGTRIRLLGIVASTTGRNGYAVLRMEPRAILSVREGDDIVPGLRLSEVASDHVIVQRGQVSEKLYWPVVTTATPPLRIGK